MLGNTAVHAGLHVAAIAFVPIPEEQLLLRLLRYTAFPLLAIGWLYSVGIYRHRLVTMDSAVHFVVHFAPTLYAHPYAAIAHAAAVVLIGSLQVRTSKSTASSIPAAAASTGPPPDAFDEESERVFRQTKSSLQHPPSI